MSKIVSKLFLVSILIILSACAPKRVEVPSYEGVDVGGRPFRAQKYFRY